MKELTENRTARARSPKGLDRIIGARIRQRRIFLGLNQYQLADVIGVTFQQVYKYEKGLNRISAGRLYMIARALGVKINFFFEVLSDHQDVEATLHRRILLDFVRNVASMKDQRHQTALSNLVRVVADTTAHNNNGPDPKPDPDLPAS